MTPSHHKTTRFEKSVTHKAEDNYGAHIKGILVCYPIQKTELRMHSFTSHFCSDTYIVHL
jgi:hypothetical protein